MIHYDGQPFKYPTVLSTAKKGERWYIYNLPNQMQLNNSLLQIKPERFQELLIGTLTGNLLTDDIIAQTRNIQKGLDILKLYELITRWNENNEAVILKHFVNQ